MTAWLARLRSRSLLVQLGVLIAVVAAAFAVVAPVAGSLHGAAGVAAATVAGCVCLLGAAVALAVARRSHAGGDAWKGVLAGMIPRMGIPMGAALFFQWRGGTLADAGLLYYLIVFYPLTLAMETLLSLPAAEPKRCSEVS